MDILHTLQLLVYLRYALLTAMHMTVGSSIHPSVNNAYDRSYTTNSMKPTAVIYWFFHDLPRLNKY